MVKKGSVQYICTNCGAASSTWSGKCFSCGEWNTLQEQLTSSGLTSAARSGKKLTAQTVKSSLSKDHKRLQTGVFEVDNVLGGGFVAGSVCLIAGQPVIGESTLLLQLAYELTKKHTFF